MASCADFDPPCGEVRGACCLDEVCEYLKPSECEDQGGEYQGDGIPCDPNPCLCTDFFVDAPGEWSGTTCGAVNDCALRDTEEVIYRVTLPEDGLWAFDLCDSTYDTYLFIGTECCLADILSQDDSPECGLQSFAVLSLTAGDYYVDVEGFSGCGDYVLKVYLIESGACCIDATGECFEMVTSADCAGIGGRFEADTACADMDPPCLGPLGACCVDLVCVATTYPGECEGDHYPGFECPEFECPEPFAGDTCANAIVIDELDYTWSGSTCELTDDYDEVCPYSGSTSPDVVFVYHAAD